MPLLLTTNIASLDAQRSLSQTQGRLAANFLQLATGLRINGAADDAAGLAISNSLLTQVRGSLQAQRNANDAVSLAQTADGGLGAITDVIGRMNELALQSANGSLNNSDRTGLQTEFGQLQQELQQLQSNTKFNGQQLIGQASSSASFQVGPNNTASDQVSVNLGGLDLSSLTSSGTSIATAGGAQSALSTLSTALSSVSTSRAGFGAVTNRFDETIGNLATSSLNLAASASRIRDADVALQTSLLAQNQVLARGGLAVLAQANQQPGIALKLLG